MAFNIVGRRFTAEGFKSYVENITFDGAFKPQFVVLHNTYRPTIAQRPYGWNEQMIENLAGYYAGQGWNGGPHLFIDQLGIWVFNPLNKRGTHSPSWNAVALGVEMLGDYDTEDFDKGPGAHIHQNAVAAVATLCLKIRVPADSVHFHKEDPKTTHKDCPGKNVNKESFIREVRAFINDASPEEANPKLVLYRRGHGDLPSVIPIRIQDGIAYADGANLAYNTSGPVPSTKEVKVVEYLGSKYTVKWNNSQKKLYAVEKAN